jgi:hypothetical protein
LAVQIYLQMDRLDLARNEVASVKTWAEDALLLQMMEAWVDLRVVSAMKRRVQKKNTPKMLMYTYKYIGWREIPRSLLYLRRVCSIQHSTNS